MQQTGVSECNHSSRCAWYANWQVLDLGYCKYHHHPQRQPDWHPIDRGAALSQHLRHMSSWLKSIENGLNSPDAQSTDGSSKTATTGTEADLVIAEPDTAPVGVWHLTDVHVDPFYITGSDATKCYCETTASCSMTGQGCFMANISTGQVPAAKFGLFYQVFDCVFHLRTQIQLTITERDRYAAKEPESDVFEAMPYVTKDIGHNPVHKGKTRPRILNAIQYTRRLETISMSQQQSKKVMCVEHIVLWCSEQSSQIRYVRARQEVPAGRTRLHRCQSLRGQCRTGTRRAWWGGTQSTGPTAALRQVSRRHCSMLTHPSTC